MTISWAKTRANLPGGAPLLKGSDVPKGTRSIKIKVTGVRTPPKGFGSPIILDIEEQFGKSAVGVNKTSCDYLAEKHGDDLEKLVGKTITLYVNMVNNPKTHKLVRSLSAVEPE